MSPIPVEKKPINEEAYRECAYDSFRSITSVLESAVNTIGNTATTIAASQAQIETDSSCNEKCTKASQKQDEASSGDCNQ